MLKKKKWLRRILCILLCVAVIGVSAAAAINAIVIFSSRGRIVTAEDAVMLGTFDCILVLGCHVRENGVPSDMLADRLRRGAELYSLGVAPKLLMSGDHGTVGYDEVDAMKQYAVDAGIPSQDVFMDHAGFSTYESMYRAKEIFQAKRILIVTQKYHLYRALYIAKMLGLEAYGVGADYHSYSGQLSRDVREVLARIKDFLISTIQPEPTYLGEAIPVSGNGDVTNDENSDFTPHGKDVTP